MGLIPRTFPRALVHEQILPQLKIANLAAMLCGARDVPYQPLAKLAVRMALNPIFSYKNSLRYSSTMVRFDLIFITCLLFSASDGGL
jgi:hypothetical protein